MHVLQVVLWYTSMTNEVHLNGMNKKEAFSHDEGYCIYVSVNQLVYYCTQCDRDLHKDKHQTVQQHNTVNQGIMFLERTCAY